MNENIVTSFVSAAVTILVAYFTYRVGKLQAEKMAQSTSQTDRTVRETEFVKSLLEMLDLQEEQMSKKDTRIERLDGLIEQSKALIDELKRANFQLTLENQRLTRETEMLKFELNQLRNSMKGQA